MQDPNLQHDPSKTHRMQMDLTIAESDLRKKQRMYADFDLQIRELKKKNNQIEFEIADKEREMKRLDSEMIIDQQNIHNLKKKIKLM